MQDELTAIRRHIQDSAAVKMRLLNDSVAIENIRQIVQACIEAYKNGGKVMWCGNGGSAADAQHMAAELVNKFYIDRPGLPSMSLSSDPSIVTAIGNDYGFDQVFARQVIAQGKKGDILIGISTSGNSKDIINAAKVCAEKGIKTVAIVGSRKCAMDSFDYVVKVPSDVTPRIQECQTLIGHIICYMIENEFFGKK